MSQYAYHGSSGMSAAPPQLTPLPSLQARPYQQDSPGPSQTLPPLNSASNIPPYSSAPYGPGVSAPHTPRAGYAPASQPMSNNSYGQPPPPAQQSIAPAQSHPSYGGSTPNYSSTQPISPYLAGKNDVPSNHNAPYNGLTLPHLTPAIYGSNDNRQPQQALPPYNVQPQLPSQPHDARGNDSRPMPVVGSQGRRGILPSASGRQPAIGSALDGSTRPNAGPTKNNEGKYPCSFCNKTYLHLKHLKRHHLRHTGERPYQCCLCQETFCRSDILKRHFSKCSIRRGNPTGAGHLTHAQAHLGQKSGSSPIPSHDSAPSSANSNSLRGQVWPNGSPAFPTNPHGGVATYESKRSSRSSSTGRPESSSGEGRDRFSSTSSYAPATTGMDGTSTGAMMKPQNMDPRFSQPQFSHDRIPDQSYRDSNNPSMYATNSGTPVSMSQAPEHSQYMHYNRGFPQYPNHQQGQVNGDDWSNYFNPGAQDPLMLSSQ